MSVSASVSNRTSSGQPSGAATSEAAGFRLRVGRFSLPPLFLILVVLPTLVAAVYYLAIAAPVYVSETTFVVRTPTQQAPTSLDSVLLGGLGGGGGGATDAYVIHDYITSREAVEDLERTQDLKAKLARPTIDFVARFPRPFQADNFENLFRAYKRFVDVGMNGQTGISTLRVSAFSPKDASGIANALLDGGEGLINRLNDRAAADAVAESHKRITEAETRVVAAETALTSFRNREQLIDPQRSSLAGLDLVAKLEGQLADMRAQRAALVAAAPKSPELAEIDRQITAFEAQLDVERTKIAGQDTSLAPTIGEYEQLTIERDFAVKELAEASTAAEAARLDVRRKRLYLERIVPPNTPDVAIRPRRLYSVVMVLISCLLIYGAVALVLAGLREHSQN